jgi:hypothetical protein
LPQEPTLPSAPQELKQAASLLPSKSNYLPGLLMEL